MSEETGIVAEVDRIVEGRQAHAPGPALQHRESRVGRDREGSVSLGTTESPGDHGIDDPAMGEHHRGTVTHLAGQTIECPKGAFFELVQRLSGAPERYVLAPPDRPQLLDVTAPHLVEGQAVPHAQVCLAPLLVEFGLETGQGGGVGGPGQVGCHDAIELDSPEACAEGAGLLAASVTQPGVALALPESGHVGFGLSVSHESDGEHCVTSCGS